MIRQELQSDSLTEEMRLGKGHVRISRSASSFHGCDEKRIGRRRDVSVAIEDLWVAETGDWDEERQNEEMGEVYELIYF